MKIDRRFFLKGLAAIGLVPAVPQAAPAAPAVLEPLIAPALTPVSPPGAAHSYQWLRNGVNIPGATAQDYVIADADSGTDIQVRITATNCEGMAIWTDEATRIPGERAFDPWCEPVQRGRRYPVRDWL